MGFGVWLEVSPILVPLPAANTTAIVLSVSIDYLENGCLIIVLSFSGAVRLGSPR